MEPPPTSSSPAGSSNSSTPVGRKVCSCGTTVLFPGAVEARTCWKCGTQLLLASPSQSQGQMLRPPERRATAPASFEPRELLRYPTPQEGVPPPAPAPELVGSSGGLFWWFVGALLLASLVVNAALFQLWAGNAGYSSLLASITQVGAIPTSAGASAGAAEKVATPPSGGISISDAAGIVVDVPPFTFTTPAPTIVKEFNPDDPDTDGDGIPDQHDFCPNKCKVKNDSGCSAPGWLSGRASDFDGDGCQDGVEDSDKDNDGVDDLMDRCPSTPNHHGFVSNAANDFDGDGCIDSLEDHDDDGDAVMNAEDECPRTVPGDSSDNRGCSKKQLSQWADKERRAQLELETRRLSAEAAALLKSAAAQAPGAASPSEDTEDTWGKTLKSAWIEVLLGALLTPLLHTLADFLRLAKQQLPSTPDTGSIQTFSRKAISEVSERTLIIRQLAVRLFVFAAFFCLVYTYRFVQNRFPDGWVNAA